MKSDFWIGMCNITLFPSIPEYTPITIDKAFSNVKQSFSSVANIMNSILLSEKRNLNNAKAK